MGRVIERVFRASSLNIAIQDGSDAGQSVPHVHAHIIPRKPADMPRPDDIYKELDGSAGDIGQHLSDARRGTFPAVDADEKRKARTLEEMQREAKWLASEMEQDYS